MLDNGTLPQDRFDKDSILVVSLRACKNQLDAMQTRFEVVSQSRRKKLLWPFDREEHVKNLEAIRNVSHLLHFSLSVTGW